MSEPLLRARAITRFFGSHAVLKGVDLEVRAGEVHVLAGENGAGKSTLIRILSGVDRDYGGTLELDGRPVSWASPQAAARQGVSVVHQELSLIGSLNVVENLMLGREPARWLRGAAELEFSRRAVERVGLRLSAAELRRPVETFALPVQSRLEIAKALCSREKVLILDEPTSALSQPDAERLFELLAELKTRGCGILYISHKMEEIERLADRVTVLRDGVGVGTLDRQTPRLVPELIRRMIGRELTEQFPPRGPVSFEGRAPALEVLDYAGPGVKAARLRVRPGEIVGLAGLQGSGASELLAGIFGAYGRPTRARIKLGGFEFPVRSPARSIRRGVAWLTNDRKATGLVLSLGVRENVTLATLKRHSRWGFLNARSERAAAEGARQALSIRTRSLSQETGALSGGNQQKVALAKWLEARPSVLLLDEPTRGVDVGAKAEIYRLIFELTEKGHAIVVISTEMPELLALSDRIEVLHRGEIVRSFDRSEARSESASESILAAAMGANA